MEWHDVEALPSELDCRRTKRFADGGVGELVVHCCFTCVLYERR